MSAQGFEGVREFPQGTRTAADAAAAIGCETIVDEDLLAYPTVWAAAGTPSSVFPIAPAELVARTGGRVERVAPVNPGS